MEEKVKESDKALLSKKIAELKRQYFKFESWGVLFNSITE